MGQRDSPFVPLAGGSIPPPGLCRPIRRAERELGPQKGARGATPNSTVRAPRKSATRPSGAARSGRSAKARLANSVGAFRDLPSLETVSVGVSARFRTFRISVQGVSAPSGRFWHEIGTFRASILVAGPGKPENVPFCWRRMSRGPESRESCHLALPSAARRRLVLSGGAGPLKTNSLPLAAPSAWRLPSPKPLANGKAPKRKEPLRALRCAAGLRPGRTLASSLNASSGSLDCSTSKRESL